MFLPGPVSFFSACFVSHGYGERRGWILVCKVRLAKEAITLLKVDTSHAVSVTIRNPTGRRTGRRIRNLHYVHVGLNRTQARPGLGSALSEYRRPSQVPQMKAGASREQVAEIGPGESTICSGGT